MIMLNTVTEIHNTFCGINNCDSSSASFEYSVWNSLFLYCNNFVYIVFLWLIHHHIVTLSKFWTHGIYNNMHICKYICFIYICQFTLFALDWLWYNSGVDFGTVAPHMDSLHLEQVERPLWGARQHPWTKQQISLFTIPSIPQGGMECQRTHSSVSACVCQLDCLHHAGSGKSLCLNTL